MLIFNIRRGDFIMKTIKRHNDVCKNLKMNLSVRSFITHVASHWTTSTCLQYRNKAEEHFRTTTPRGAEITQLGLDHVIFLKHQQSNG